MAPLSIRRLGEIRVSMLIMIRDEDVADFLKIADILTAGITSAKKVVIPGVAHLPNMEKPQEFDQIVVDFLNERAR